MRWTDTAAVPAAVFLVLAALSSQVMLACVDSDGGKDAYARGNLTYEVPNGTMIVSDECDRNDPSNNKRLIEHYCSEQGAASSVFIECAHLCYDGRCVREDEVSGILGCKDTDGGSNPYERGTITGRVNIEASPGTFSDYCLVGEANVLMEYFCSDDGLVEIEMVECQDDCYEGACDEEVKDCASGMLTRTVFYDMGEFSLSDSMVADNDVECCVSADHCLLQGECYGDGLATMIDGVTIYCDSGKWKDCDGSEEACTQECHLKWAKLGEAKFIGEYDREVDDCCGDDLGEYAVNGSDGVVACCDDPTDRVREGVCYKQNNETVNISRLHEKIKEAYEIPPAVRNVSEAIIENLSDEPAEISDVRKPWFWRRIWLVILNLFN